MFVNKCYIFLKLFNISTLADLLVISIVHVGIIELKPLIISASHSNLTSAIDDLLVTGIVEQGEPELLVVYFSISVELFLLSIFDMDDIHKSFKDDLFREIFVFTSVLCNALLF